MRIYEMTATFGKLEHETLKLQPGLNIVHAPNEWGKSTWCAFLLAMLYGMDTKAKTTKTALADKERFLPWSGSPMSGRIDLHWNGRDITIERSTKGRVPLGVFRAYETETGALIPELTAANCGQQLLGVEQSVFRRSGFIRLSDLPVTRDEALLRRLNALVTTGDESGDGDRLERDLRELKNRCRYNRSGLLPQAEAEREELERKLEEIQSLQIHSRKLKQRLGEINGWLRQLENHQDALSYAAAEADAARVADARDTRDQATARLETLEAASAKLPSPEDAQKKIHALRQLQAQWDSVQMEAQLLPGEPEMPELPEPFRNLSLQQAQNMVETDSLRYRHLTSKNHPLVFFLPAGFLFVLSVLLVFLQSYLTAALSCAAGILLLIPGILKNRSRKKEAASLAAKYASDDPAHWQQLVEDCIQRQQEYDDAKQHYRHARGDLDARVAQLQNQRQSLCGAQSPEKVLQVWQDVLRRWEEFHNARRDAQMAENHLKTLEAMVKPAKRPQMADELTYTAGETARLLSDALQEQQRLQHRLGQYQGRMETLGEEDALQKQLARISGRICSLEDTYAALTIAQETLRNARMELQRRFAPRIAARARELLAVMTDGRYDRLTLGEDFTLHAGALQEDTLHEALWRSDGTVDQLYLALRLAVSGELTPEAPLILDDALVRFDDERMKAALDILKKESETKQVILFSCQKRELDAME